MFGDRLDKILCGILSIFLLHNQKCPRPGWRNRRTGSPPTSRARAKLRVFGSWHYAANCPQYA
jgi:hypothetical protein